MNFSSLFQPGAIGRLRLKNRIFFPAMTSWLAGPTGDTTDELVSHYERIAKGGAGLIVVETAMAATAVDPYRHLVRALRADDDCFNISLFQLTEAIHEAGAKVAVQLSPGPGSIGSIPWEIGCQGVRNIQRVSSSPVQRMGGPPAPRELTISEIEKMIELYALSAQRIKLVEFDAIEIHAMGGFLIAQFLSPMLNKREDEYGGDLKGRMKFLTDLIRATQAKVGSDFPVWVRYAVDEFHPEGRRVEESKEIAKTLESLGVHAISLNSGMHGETSEYVSPPFNIARGHDLPLFKEVKKTVGIPVMVAGGLDLGELAEKVLNEEYADLVGIGRGLLADPDLPQKIEAGEIAAIRKCIRCNECRGLNKRPFRCTVNAQVGRQYKYGEIREASHKKKVVVVGGGPGGMEAARVAALRGHSVTLMEKGSFLGGALHLAAIPPHKEEIRFILEYYQHTLPQFRNLDIQLNMEAEPGNIQALKPDIVILATGGEPFIPTEMQPIRENAVTAYQVLRGHSVGDRVIVVGGGLIGCETAAYIAQLNKHVILLEVLESIGADMEPLVRKCMMKELNALRVEIHNKTRVRAITEKGVVVVENGQEKQFKGDSVVLALGITPVNGLKDALKGKARKIIVIGDAKVQGKIRTAVNEGFMAGYHL